MKKDQHADTFEDEEADVEICPEIDLVEEVEAEVNGRHRDARFKQEVCRLGGPRLRVLDSHRDEKPGIPGGSATTRQDGSRQGHARIPEKQMRVRLGGVTRPVDLWHGKGGTLEEAAKEMLGIPTRTETHVMADAIGWRQKDWKMERLWK